ncbi:MAG: HD-GYP domain-containing protein [Cetobacterium sp.]|uniref:HD-GYP domain-containing protein n=2 Tax=Cetobacterium sp. TaxID=2071632 RepID=UPI0025C0A361|nr:HD domain-containing phosphohydrolase [Cetobacterium sp.]
MGNIIHKKYQKLVSYILEFFIRLYDKDTWLHIKRIKLYSKEIALELECPISFISEISLVSSLHDLGKIFISKKILNKNGKLTKEEFDQMKKHSLYGEKILLYLGFGKVAKNIALYHHEHFDGNGYPNGLKGDLIPLEAKIVTLVDVYDALRQKRCYKNSFSHEKAIEIIKSQEGKQFERIVVKAFLKNNRKFNEIFEKMSLEGEKNYNRLKIIEKIKVFAK